MLLALAVLAGCASHPTTPEPSVTVQDGPSGAPELTYAVPLAIPTPREEVIWPGTGPRLRAGKPVLINYRLENATNGELIEETYSAVPKSFLLAPELIGADLYNALRGKSVGARVLALVPASAKGADAPAVLVVDVLSTRAVGDRVPPRKGLPGVRLRSDGSPRITIPSTAPPSDLVVQTLVRGTGAQVAAGATVTVQYTGVRWKDGAEVDSTWSTGAGPTSFRLGEAIAGWAQGLVEQTVGSQVLLVIPPSMANVPAAGKGGAGNTLVFVVDILSASTPGRAAATPSPTARK